MTEEREREELHPDDDDLSADDVVIGRALKRSLQALLALAVVAAAVWWIAGRPESAAPETAIETEAPEEVVREAVAPSMPFTDVTAAAGIDFVHQNGAAGEKLLPETMGSGAAFFDADNDGDQDLLLLNGDHWPHSRPAGEPRPASAFYLNDGAGRFTDASREAGLDLTLYATGVAAGDVDGDGWTDLFVAAVGANRLLKNRGGRFEDVTAAAGVAGDPTEWSTSAAFVDVDGDGDLDLFVCNYVRWSKEIDFELDYRLTGVGRAYGPPVNYQGTFSYLYLNDGGGVFRDVSAESGIQVTNPATGVPVGKALGVAPVDVDGDGAIDLLVANDTVQNFLFHNLGDGTFEEVGELWGVAYGRNGEATGAMGIDAAHYRNDAELGVAIGNFANEMTSLYLSQGDPTLYADEAIGEGIGAPSRRMLSFGVLFLDVDLDGRLDVLQANGHLENEIASVDPSQSYEQPAQLFWNAGPEARQGFVAVDPETTGDLGRPIVGRSAAYADVDGDGDLDLVLTQTGQRALLLQNDQGLGHHWLRLRLEGDGANREAIGARVELTVAGVTQRRQVMGARGYQSQSELPVTFGLGEATAIESLVVTWPDGTVEEIEPPAIDAEHAVRQGS